MIDQYFEYFRNIAETHPAINHLRDNETLNGDPSLCKFGRFWEPDIYAQTPPRGCAPDSPTLLLHLIEGDTNDLSGEYAIQGDFSGGFIISSRAVKNDHNDEARCYTDCWEIVMDILKKMNESNINYDPCDFDTFARFDLSNYQMMQVGPLWDNRFGYWVRFGFNIDLNLIDRADVFTPPVGGEVILISTGEELTFLTL